MRSLRRTSALLSIATAITLSTACGPGDDRSAADAHRATAIADHECAACGMLVRDQSAPRAQVVHRDGSRFFLCSLGDLLVHLDAPSPHGRAAAIFVEVMQPHEQAMTSHPGEHPWIPADEAVYVVGVPRSGIMGTPVLAYADRSDAHQLVSANTDAQLLAFDALRSWWARR
jgi:nitrous oxide reductase accessory protein NosL